VAALAELATKPEAAPNIAKSEREDNLFRFVFIVLIAGVSINFRSQMRQGETFNTNTQRGDADKVKG
jgi:hypothetical protein